MIDADAVVALLSWRALALGALFGTALLILVVLVTRKAPDRGVILDAAGVKLAAALVFVLYSVFVFRGGDTFFYHDAGLEYSAALRGDETAEVTVTNCFEAPRSAMLFLCYVSGYVHVASFDSFLASTFVFAMLGFVGQVLLYRTFAAALPDPRLRRWWLVGILFLPSLVFWSSGMLKEPLRMLALGGTVWGVYTWRHGRPAIGIVTGLLGGIGMWLFSPSLLPGIAIALVPLALVGTAFGAPAEPMRQHAGVVALQQPSRKRWLLLAVSLLAMFWIAGRLSPEYSLERIPQSIVDQSQLYDGQEDARLLEPLVQEASWSALLRAWPAAIVLSLFRPFPWEVRGWADLLAAGENVVLLFLSLRAVGNTLSRPAILIRAWRAPLFQTCVLMVVLLCLAVGATTPNFGSLSRYRLPVLPFFVGALAVLRTHWLQCREEPAPTDRPREVTLESVPAAPWLPGAARLP